MKQEASATETETTVAQEPSAEERRALNKKHSRSGLYAVVHALLAWPLRLLFRMHVTGQAHEPRRGEGAYLVIANHTTWRDPIFLCAALTQQQPHFMGKQELFRIPVFNWLIRALGAYPVRRGGADVGAIRHTITMLKQGKTVGMFPQGHRFNGVEPATTPVKSGAAMIALKAGVPVLPVFIGFKEHKVKLFCKKQIIIGQPIYPEEMAYDATRPGEYQRIADMLFARVCALETQATSQDTHGKET